MGQAVGLSRVTVSRVLERLADEGAVRPGYRTIALLDRALLEQAAEGQPTGEK
ncbi:MAG: helix-turn-helix domain-containing protein [Oscillospiraceae bacterium]